MKIETDRLLSERANLQSYLFSANITIKFNIKFSCFDGKIVKILTGNISNQRCNLCHMLPREYKGLEDIDLSLRSKLFTEEICTAPLHFGERAFDHLFKLGCRQDIKKYRKDHMDDDEKMCLEFERLFMIDRLLHQLGVLIDMPGSSGGNTTNGNSIRRCWEEPWLLAEVFGLPIKLVKGIIVVWKCLRSPITPDVTRFKKYCMKLVRLYEHELHWAEMAPALHLILHHGWLLLQAIPEHMNISMFNEEGLEAINKKIKHYEKNRARQTSRPNRLSDVFQRINDFSYPVILDKIAERAKKVKKSNVPDVEVLRLLPYEISGYSSSEDDDDM